jgi:riboflavin synthase
LFTGIVEELGTVLAAPGREGRLVVGAGTVATDSGPGASVAVNGVCLTVVGRSGPDPAGRWTLAFDVSEETSERSCVGGLRPGDPVNLERPVTLLARLGGHLVQGHVDGVAEVAEVSPEANGCRMRFSLPRRLGRYVVEKGSVAVDGVSLTVTDVAADGFGVALVPYTLEATTLGSRRPGDRVNLEVDVTARYVERLMGRAGDGPAGETIGGDR